jgi:hypothetical protein
VPNWPATFQWYGGATAPGLRFGRAGRYGCSPAATRSLRFQLVESQLARCSVKHFGKRWVLQRDLACLLRRRGSFVRRLLVVAAAQNLPAG